MPLSSKNWFFVLLLTVITGNPLVSFSQTPIPPIPMEFMFGQDRMDYQLVMKRNFTPQSKFSVLAIAVFSENYGKERQVGDAVVIPLQVNYALGNSGLSLAAGAEANSVAGFSNFLGLAHSKATKKLLAITVLSYQLKESQDLKLFGLYEYKPPLSENWSLYTRLQFTYNQGLRSSVNNRSFIYLRAGLKKGPFGFGLGANLDAYGASKIPRENYGLFTRWEF